MAVRFRTRFLHATIVDEVTDALRDLGRLTPPINFGVQPARIIDYQPDERGEQIAVNTVAITLGDGPEDVDEELGAAVGGLRSVTYPVYIDAYMSGQPISVAVIDDLRDHFTDLVLPLKDKIRGGVVDGVVVAFEEVRGPERPPASIGADQFKKFWRVQRMLAVIYFNT